MTDAAGERRGPWFAPSPRRKARGQRRIERAARRGELWGSRTSDARRRGPAAVAAVSFDRLRATVADLPEGDRPAAWQAVTEALDGLRGSLTES